MRRAFSETCPEVLTSTIKRITLGTIVERSIGGIGRLAAPFEVAREWDGTVVLRCHLPGRRLRLEDGALLSASFVGPHAYVSPTWYDEAEPPRPHVPTWNYVFVEAEGPVTLHRDPVAMRTHLESLTRMHEPPPPRGWSIDDLPERYVAGKIESLVLLEIRVSQLRGTFKLSQDKPGRDRLNIARRIREAPGDRDADLADWIEAGVQHAPPERTRE